MSEQAWWRCQHTETFNTVWLPYKPVGPYDCVPFVRKSDYDALHAEAEALRAENGQLSQQLAQSDCALRESRANDMTNVRTLEDMWERHDALRQELEAARGLLEQRIPCDVMLPPATTIKRGCPLSTVLAGMKMRENIPANQQVFSTTPQPGPDVRALVKECLDDERECWTGDSSQAVHLALDDAYARVLIALATFRQAQQGA